MVVPNIVTKFLNFEILESFVKCLTCRLLTPCLLTSPAKKQHEAIMMKTLKAAEPTMALIPVSSSDMKVPVKKLMINENCEEKKSNITSFFKIFHISEMGHLLVVYLHG